jgi:hypothetical protein
MIKLLSSRTQANMSAPPKLPFGIQSRRREPDEWDKTIVAFQSPYRLKDLCIDQSADQPGEAARVSKQEFKVRLATTEDRRKSASLLIEKMYSWRGYEADALGKDPHKITLMSYQEENVVGTLTLGLDSPDGMVVDELYKREADQLRASGRKPCDITRLAVDHDIKSKSVLAALFHLSFIYGRNIHRATDFLIEVNPRHVYFYQRMLGFEPFGEEKICPRVNAPAVLLKLDLSHADAQIIQYGGLGSAAPEVKSIYPYFFSREDELGITQRLLKGE